MRRLALVGLIACGGSAKPAAQPTQAVVATNGCASAYAEYESRWKAARTDDLQEVGFDAESIGEVIAIEVAILPTRADMTKLRGQYTAVAVFLPDSPWPRALDAADHAIDQCGEEAPRPH